MASRSTSAVRTLLPATGIALVLFLVVGGCLVRRVALLVLRLAMGGGALLSRTAGPPER